MDHAALFLLWDSQVLCPVLGTGFWPLYLPSLNDKQKAFNSFHTAPDLESLGRGWRGSTGLLAPGGLVRGCSCAVLGMCQASSRSPVGRVYGVYAQRPCSSSPGNPQILPCFEAPQDLSSSAHPSPPAHHTPTLICLTSGSWHMFPLPD